MLLFEIVNVSGLSRRPGHRKNKLQYNILLHIHPLLNKIFLFGVTWQWRVVCHEYVKCPWHLSKQNQIKIYCSLNGDRDVVVGEVDLLEILVLDDPQRPGARVHDLARRRKGAPGQSRVVEGLGREEEVSLPLWGGGAKTTPIAIWRLVRVKIIITIK